MASRERHLFSDNDLSAVLEKNLNRAQTYIDSISRTQFINSDVNEIIEHVFSKFEGLPLILHEDHKTLKMDEIKIDVQYDPRRAVFSSSDRCLIAGISVVVSIPFEGDEALWKCRPSLQKMNAPCAYICTNTVENKGQVKIVEEGPLDTVGDGTELKRAIDKTIEDIKFYIDQIKDDIDTHNKRLRSHIQQCCSNRKKRLGKYAEIAKVLNIPLKRDANAPDLTSLPIKRKLVKPLPSPSNKSPEPGIREEDYNHILSVIRHEGRTFETTPKTFAKHDEEELRDIILAHLNGHYEGQATGESFRKSGKTDIRIEDQSRSAFVAECKVWRGESEINKAFEQLLGYLTWRDCKGALIIFNLHNARFSELQTKLPEAIKNSPLFIKKILEYNGGEWRFQLRSLEDEEHIVTIHVFLFNLYVKE